MAGEELADVIVEVGDGLHAEVVGDHVWCWDADGVGASRRVVRRTSLTPSAARRLVDAGAEPSIVVVDLIDSGATEVLREAAWSFWDRRGRLRLWLPELGYRLDVPTRRFVSGVDGPVRPRPIAGVGGISAALLTLIDPRHAGVRRIARAAAITASTVSRARRSMIDAALISVDGDPLVPELFWALSDVWTPRPVAVSERPQGDEWVLAGDTAATRWGAPVLGSRARFYSASRRAFDRFVYLHRSDDDTGVEVSLAPTPLVLATAHDGVVDPVVAALDLSRSARGRDVLHDWSSIAHRVSGGASLGGVVWL